MDLIGEIKTENYADIKKPFIIKYKASTNIHLIDNKIFIEVGLNPCQLWVFMVAV